MYTVMILMCSIYHPGEFGCGPGKVPQENVIIVGKAVSEAQCFMMAYAEMPKHPATDELFPKAICIKGG